MRFRMLHLLLFGCLILLVVKIVELFSHPQEPSSSLLISPAYAVTASADKPKEGEKKADKTVKKEGEKKEGEKKPEDDKNVSTEAPKQAETAKFTDTEVEILQRLSLRRQELENWQKELEMKENVLSITQNKINQKLEELRKMKTEVEVVLNEYNKKEDAKTASLIKIYEKMKPKPAAEIFSQLDMNTLVKVVKGMKEQQVAAIMANMDPKRARELTQTFAQNGSLPVVPNPNLVTQP